MYLSTERYTKISCYTTNTTQEKIFRENNVLFMMIVLAGCVVGYGTVFVLSQLTKLNNFVCGVQYWFFGIAFVLTFGYVYSVLCEILFFHKGL